MRRAVSRVRAALVATGLALGLAACATAPPLQGGGLAARRLPDGRPRAYNRPYEVGGRWYTPADQPGYDRVGIASWYSYESSSGRTADGERFDARLATAAHTTLPIPSWLEVTDLENGRSARVRLNDRGPFVPGRIIDLSKAAAIELGIYVAGRRGCGCAISVRRNCRERARSLGPGRSGPARPGRCPSRLQGPGRRRGLQRSTRCART